MNNECKMLTNNCLFYKIYNEYTTAKVPKRNVVYPNLVLSNGDCCKAKEISSFSSNAITLM